MDIQTKYSFENFQITVDFSDVLSSGEILSAAVSNVYAYDFEGNDVSSTIISNIAWNDSDVDFYVGAGDRWQRYFIRVQAGSNIPQYFEKQLTVLGWALTTLNEVKTHVSPTPPTTDHVLLLNLIGEATDFIERRCSLPPDWHLLETKHEDELYDGTECVKTLFLRQYPILYVEKLEDDDVQEVRERKWRTAATYTSTGMTVSATQPDGFTFTAQDATRSMQVEVRAPTAGEENQVTRATIGTRNSATEVTFDSNGWSNGTPSTSDKFRFTSGFFLYPYRGKIYWPEGFTSGYQNVKVTYRAGYRNVPGDLNLLCKKLVTGLYAERERMGLKSEKIGNYAYTRMDQMLDKDDKATLMHHRILDIA
jgi:hypothetical protein